MSGARSVGWGVVGHLAVPASTGVLVLGLPFLLDPQTYGYWQLYLFYALWLGYLTYGVPDGHNLRYAGRGLGALHPGRFAGTLGHLVVGVAVAAAVLAVVGVSLTEDRTQALMWVLACASTVFFVPRTLLTAALQAASRFGHFAAVVLVERGLVLALTLVTVVAVGARPGALATADLVAKAVGLSLALVVLHRLLTGARRGDGRADDEPGAPHTPEVDLRGDGRTDAWAETRAHVPVRTVLVLANLAALAAHGVLRLAVERRWGVVEFGQVSLAFSAALLVTTAAHAVGWTSLPRLARTTPEHRGEVHRLVRDGARAPLALLVLLYLPAEALLMRWLPDYRTALVYLGLLLPLVVVESRWRVVTAGLLKVMGRQQVLLTINLLTLALAVLLALWFTLVAPSQVGVVVSLLVVTVVRSSAADVWLARQLHETWLAGVLLDLLVVVGLLGALTLDRPAAAAAGLVVVALAAWWHRRATAQLVTRVREEMAA